jgi:hypothetical protein
VFPPANPLGSQGGFLAHGGVASQVLSQDKSHGRIIGPLPRLQAVRTTSREIHLQGVAVPLAKLDLRPQGVATSEAQQNASELVLQNFALHVCSPFEATMAQAKAVCKNENAHLCNPIKGKQVGASLYRA